MTVPPAAEARWVPGGSPGSAHIVLASASPRRRAIVAALGLSFDAVDVAVDERPRTGELPAVLALRLGAAKALAGALRFPGRVVVGADTVVALDGVSLGKPQSPEDAVQTLRMLRGRSHEVMTGVAAAYATGPQSAPTCWTALAATRVHMRDYTDAELDRYVASGDPFDKAGSYAIQHGDFHPVERWEGCYLNVVGMPLSELCSVLRRAGVDVPPISEAALLPICPGCTDRVALGSAYGAASGPLLR